MDNDSRTSKPLTSSSTRKIIVLLGSAGSGKSVQSKLLADQTGWTWLSTGKLLRESRDEVLHSRLNKGELIDDSYVIEVLTDALLRSTQACIIDGFPRTAAQAEWLLSWTASHRYPITDVVHLAASREVASARLYRRRRDDDTDEAIHARFDEYDNVIRPILKDFAASKVPIHEISADGSIEAVHTEIVKRVL